MPQPLEESVYLQFAGANTPTSITWRAVTPGEKVWAIIKLALVNLNPGTSPTIAITDSRQNTIWAGTPVNEMVDFTNPLYVTAGDTPWTLSLTGAMPIPSQVRATVIGTIGPA